MNTNMSAKIEKSGIRKFVFFRIFKYLLIFFGSMALLILLFGSWLYFSLVAGPGPFEFNEYHPFKSPKAKIEYLAFEDKMAKTWPVFSEVNRPGEAKNDKTNHEISNKRTESLGL